MPAAIMSRVDMLETDTPCTAAEAVPQHFQLYVTLFICAATSKTEPFLGSP